MVSLLRCGRGDGASGRARLADAGFGHRGDRFHPAGVGSLRLFRGGPAAAAAADPTALLLITAIYLLRGLALLPLLVLKPQLADTFAVVSSLVVLAYGLTYAIGTWRAWPALGRRK